MQLKMFVVPIKNVSEAEAEMNGFLRGHRVLAVKKEFVADGENSFWTFCVEYLDGVAVAAAAVGGRRPPKVDYKEVLTPEEFEVFSRLRDWRKAAAGKEGVPVYAVLTNEQLAQVVQKKVKTKAGLKDIEGVGEARMEKYGAALLRLLGVPEGPPTS
jgi:superfamily II DNA helicase RecQ